MSLSSFNLHRKDRTQSRGGGVCVFIADNIPCKRRTDLEDTSHECLWLWICPHRLPRPYSGILLGAVYNPPGRSMQEQRNLSDFIVQTLDSIRNSSPNCAVIILGDFNDLDFSDIVSCHNLKQVVQCPTRGNNILNRIISNFSEHYSDPISYAPLGSSDHNVVFWSPKFSQGIQSGSNITKRCLRSYARSNQDAFGRWISEVNWFGNLWNPTVDKLTDHFTSSLSSAIGRFFPLRSVRCHRTDKPWITPAIKRLVHAHQKAYHSNDPVKW